MARNRVDFHHLTMNSCAIELPDSHSEWIVHRMNDSVHLLMRPSPFWMVFHLFHCNHLSKLHYFCCANPNSVCLLASYLGWWNVQDLVPIETVPSVMMLAMRNSVTSTVDDQYEHPINPDLDCSCSGVFDHGYHHWPIAHALSNFAISYDDFETKFSPEKEQNERLIWDVFLLGWITYLWKYFLFVIWIKKKKFLYENDDR